jgi:GNAT superfamily N-acetyltransferase
MQGKGRIRWATEADVPTVMELIRELAEYERALDEVNIGEDILLRDGFGPDPAYGLLVLEPANRDVVVGIALFYQKYSTWNGRCLYLEDLVVTESERGKGYGLQLFAAVAAETTKRGCAYMQWQVLDWNEPAIGFYRSLGSAVESDWLNGRLEGEALDALAATSA